MSADAPAVDLQAAVDQLMTEGVQLRVVEGVLRYRARPGGISPQRFHLLRTRKDEIVAMLNNGASASGERRSPVTSEAELRTSMCQEIWMRMDQAGLLSAGAHPFLAVRLRGECDPDILNQSLHEVLSRQENLRGRFRIVEGKVLQRPVRFGREVELLQVMPAKSKDLLLDQIREVLAQPLDSAEGQLLRARLIVSDPKDCVLVLLIHHAVCDAFSKRVLWREIALTYDALCGRGPGLEQPDAQLVDYSLWERHWLQGEVLQKFVQFWNDQYARMRPPSLASDWPRTTTRGANRLRAGVERQVMMRKMPSLLREADDRLNHLGTTKFVLLLATLVLSVHGWTGEEDVTVACATTGRMHDAAESMVGCFARTPLVRVDLVGNPTLATVQERTAVALGMMIDRQSWTDVKLESERGLHQILLNYFPVRTARGDEGNPSAFGVETIAIPQLFRRSVCDVQVLVREYAEGTSARCCYNAELFKASTIKRYVDYFEYVFGTLITKPSTKLSELLPLIRS